MILQTHDDDNDAATPGNDEFAQTFRETWACEQNFVAIPLRLTRLSADERARTVSRNSSVTKLNLLVANMMENGYANIAEFSSVSHHFRVHSRMCIRSHWNDAETDVHTYVHRK